MHRNIAAGIVSTGSNLVPWSCETVTLTSAPLYFHPINTGEIKR